VETQLRRAALANGAAFFRWRGVKLALIYLASWSILLLGLDRNALNVYDEGDVLFGGLRVLWGDVPYRDFWTVYGPAQYWVVAFLFKIFGPFILVERAWDAAVRAGMATLAYMVARALTNARLAVGVWLFSLGWLWVVGSYGYPLLPAALFGLASAYLSGRYAVGLGGVGGLLGAGALVTLAGFFRYDIGIYTYAAEVAVILAVPGVIRSGADFGRMASWNGRMSAVAWLTSGAMLAFVPVAAYLFVHVPPQDLLHPLVIYPAKIYPGARSLPYPSLVEPLYDLLRGKWIAGALTFCLALALYFPWVVAGAGAFGLWRLRQSPLLNPKDKTVQFAILVLVLIVLAFSVKTLVRPQAVHAIHALVPGFVLAGLLISMGDRLRAKPVQVVLVVAMVALAYPPLDGLYLGARSSGIGRLLRTGTGSPVENAKRVVRYFIDPGNGPDPAIYFTISADQAAAVSYIRTHTGPRDKLFVANGRHDIALANDVLFYFLAQRAAVTKYHEFNPGLTTTSQTQQAIIEALRAESVPYVVRMRSFDNISEPNSSARSSGVILLDQFLEREYTEVARFGQYEITQRRQ
jgi:hypothetical protein